MKIMVLSDKSRKRQIKRKLIFIYSNYLYIIFTLTYHLERNCGNVYVIVKR